MVLYGFTDIYKKTGRGKKKAQFADNQILKAIEPNPRAASPRIRRRQERFAPELDDLFQQGLHPSRARLPWPASAISMRESNEEEEKLGKEKYQLKKREIAVGCCLAGRRGRGGGGRANEQRCVGE